MLHFLFFVILFGFVNSKEVFCDYNEKYCQGKTHVLCVTEQESVNRVNPEKTEPTNSELQMQPKTMKSVSSPNSVEASTSPPQPKPIVFPDTISSDTLAIAKKMMRHPKDKETCESACFKTDTIHVIDVLCQTNLIYGLGYVCDYAAYGMNCINFTEVKIIEDVDYVPIIQDFQIIILYILLFGIFLLNISICVVVNTLSRYN